MWWLAPSAVWWRTGWRHTSNQTINVVPGDSVRELREYPLLSLCFIFPLLQSNLINPYPAPLFQFPVLNSRDVWLIHILFPISGCQFHWALHFLSVFSYESQGSVCLCLDMDPARNAVTYCSTYILSLWNSIKAKAQAVSDSGIFIITGIRYVSEVIWFRNSFY